MMIIPINLKKIKWATVIFLSLAYTNNFAQQQISFSDPRIQYQGRVGMKDTCAEIYWPGSSFTISFKGSIAKAVLNDEKGYNYFNVIVDNHFVKTFRVSPEKQTYILADSLTDGTHSIEIAKRADWFRGKTSFYGLELDDNAKISKPASKKRTIEFYGNSITVGASVEDNKGDSGDSTYTNNYKSYASITARHFDANYSCIASSGIGLLVSWGSLIMPDIYNRLNPDDSSSVWDFSKIRPDVVVINLFQNDYALFNHPEHPQFKRRFGEKAPGSDSVVRTYTKFVKQLRTLYPDAYILCVLGTMDAVKPGSAWPGYIESAVTSLHDKKIFTYFFPYRNKPGHPKEMEHKQMAKELIAFIEQHVKW